MYKKLFWLIIFIGCSSNQIEIKEGEFELYENEKHVGTIFRLKDYQVEKYNNEPLFISKLKWISDSTYYLKGTEINPMGIDTVIYRNTFKKIDKDKFRILITPINSDIAYKFEGVLVKKSNSIPRKFLDTLIYLNNR